MIVPATAVVPLESMVACCPPETVADFSPVAVTTFPLMVYASTALLFIVLADWTILLVASSEIWEVALDFILPSLSNSKLLSPTVRLMDLEADRRILPFPSDM